MKICPKCNNQNRDEAKFCSTCGENLGVQPSDTTDSNPVQDNTAAESKPTDVPVGQPAVDNPVSGVSTAPANPVGKKSKGLFVVAGIAVIAVIFLLIRFISSADPVSKLIKGFAKLARMKEITSTTTIDINYDGDDEIGEIINDMVFKVETAADMDNLLTQLTLELVYDKKSVTQLAAGINNEDVYVDLKELYNKVFYQDMEELVPDYQDYVNDYKLIKKAVNDVNIKFDNKKYIKIIRDTLDDDIKGSGSKVILTLNSKTMTKLMKNLLEEAEDDAKLMESVRKNAIDLVKRILKDKKKFKVIEVDELEDLLETLEDKDDFEDYYINVLAAARSSLEYGLNYQLDTIKDMEITFIFGSSGSIKKIEYTATVDADGDDLEILFSTEIKSGAKFTKVNKKNAIAIEDLMSDYDEMEEIFDDITENLIKTVKKNKKLTEKIEELSGEDVEDAIEYMMYNVFSFLIW
ncbi:MAG TPA: zinc ribbon domain-containing protein [Clostridiaceae bacterium]|nr:zinc ribbon domain-containing protein [Clostridiaceae bacterium]